MGVLEREALAQREERDDDAAEPEGTDEELEQPRAEASGLVDGHWHYAHALWCFSTRGERGKSVRKNCEDATPLAPSQQA